MTLRSLERGGSGVTMGAYLAVMQVLGIEKDLDLVGAADPLGRELQDARLQPQGKPSAHRASSTHDTPVMHSQRTIDTNVIRDQPRNRQPDPWLKNSDFASADSLVDLLDTTANNTSKKRR
jgi:hypothetical protein